MPWKSASVAVNPNDTMEPSLACPRLHVPAEPLAVSGMVPVKVRSTATDGCPLATDGVLVGPGDEGEVAAGDPPPHAAVVVAIRAMPRMPARDVRLIGGSPLFEFPLVIRAGDRAGPYHART